MGIDFQRLSPKAQQQVMKQLMGKKQGKYHNEPDCRGSIRFDSRAEARRYDELIEQLRAGKISELKLQPQFTLQEAYSTPEGDRIRAIRYQADFSYRQNGQLIVEDVKSKATKTRVYELKKKLMREKFGIGIREVQA